MFANNLKLLLIAFLSSATYAADYYVVVPFKNKAAVYPDGLYPRPAISLELASYNLTPGVVNQPYPTLELNTLLRVTGDQNFDSAKVRWALSAGRLPTGMTITSDGKLSGTPTASGTYSFNISATYFTTTGIQNYILNVEIPISISLGARDIPAGQVGQQYFYDFKELLTTTGIDINSTEISWIIQDGAVPSGLTLDEKTGTITGIPSAPGSYYFTINAKFNSISGVQTYSLPITLTTTSFLAHMNSLSEPPAAGSYDVMSPAITLDSVNYVTGGASFYNNTSNARLKMLGDATTTFGVGDFTIEFWARRTRRDADYSAYMFSMAGVAQIWVDDLTASNTNNKLYFSTAKSSIAAPSYMALNTWYHLALVRKNGIVSAFVNGRKIGNFADTTNYTQQDINIFSKATMQSAPNNYRSFYGNIDEARVSKEARYEADFTPSVVELNP